MIVEVIATVRSFNRSYTRRIGVLDESYLGSGRALGPSRLLFELGAGAVSVVELLRWENETATAGNDGFFSGGVGQLCD